MLLETKKGPPQPGRCDGQSDGEPKTTAASGQSEPEKATSGVLSLSFIGSVFYASLISDVDYMPNGLQYSSRLDAGPLLR
jgi:hypothetical protein